MQVTGTGGPVTATSPGQNILSRSWGSARKIACRGQKLAINDRRRPGQRARLLRQNPPPPAWLCDRVNSVLCANLGPREVCNAVLWRAR